MLQFTTSVVAILAIIYWYTTKQDPDEVFNIRANSSYDYIIGK